LFLAGKQRTIPPISRRPNFTKFEHSTSIGVAMNPFGTKFENFNVKGSFFQKNAKMIFFQRLATSGRHNSAMITDLRKVATRITLYVMSSFHFYCLNQFKIIPWPVDCVQKPP